MIQSINDNRTFLQRELTLRGSGIAKRWKKKTWKNREGLLKSIDPDMYDRKWHEAHISYEMRYDDWFFEARKHQNIYLLPYMSLKNLKEDPSRLLKLLQLWTNSSSADLAVADNRRITYGWKTGIFETAFNGCAILMYGPRYGSLVPWVSDEVHRGDSIGFPRGQLILKAQSRLLSILRGVVEVLIDGLPEDGESITSTNLNLLVLPDNVENTVYVDEAFSSYPFDLKKLAEVSNGRLNSARDHLSHLQTDPAYMRRYVQLVQNSGYSELPEKVTFVMTAQDLDYEAWTIRHWTWVSEEISELMHLQSRFSDQINRGQTVPLKYSTKLASLEALILHLFDIQSRHIQCTFPYRPGFQHHYNLECSMSAGRAFMSHGIKNKSDDPLERSILDNEAWVKDPLHWCIEFSTTHPDARGVWDKFCLFEFLDQHLGKATAEERARIDETLLRKISDLAAFNELLKLVRSHRPRAVQRDIAEFGTIDQGLAWRFMSKQVVNSELGRNREQITSDRTLQEIPLAYATLGPLLKTFMDHEPAKDRSDRTWLTNDIAQRKLLRSFWENFRQQHQQKLQGVGISPADIADDLKLISADKDPGFLATIEAERKQFLATTTSVPSPRKERPRPRQVTTDTNTRQERHPQGLVEPVNVPALSNNLRSKKGGNFNTNAEVQTEWGTTPIATKPASDTKTKPKIRGEASVLDQEIAYLNITSADDNQQPSEKVQVKKSAFEVFSNLFARGGSKSVLWDTFVDAMAKAGFMSRRSGGSAVTFEPNGESKWYGQGSIVFHRPHPDSTIDPVMRNSIGKRMKKWFGWGNETCELGN